MTKNEYIKRFGIEAWEKYQLHYGTPKHKLRKTEFIKIYGEAEWNDLIKRRGLSNRKAYKKNPETYLKSNKKWTDNNKDQCKAIRKRYHEAHKEEQSEYLKNWYIENREHKIKQTKMNRHKRLKQGRTTYCTENFDCIENYNEALAHNFDGFTQHHRFEMFWTARTLKAKSLYQNVGPFNLEWLPAKEHKDDGCLAIKYPERSIWHKHMYQDLSNRNAELHTAELTEQPITDPKIQALLDEYVHKPFITED